jgi:hypothetical protein
MHVFSSWEARNPKGDWEFEAPGTLYHGLSWPVMVAVLWTITAITDAIMARTKPVSADNCS